MSDNDSIYDDFIEFRAVIIKAVALSWHDDNFKKSFHKNPVKALKDEFGYKYPFNIEFKGEERPKDDYKWYPEGTGAWVGPNNKLELVLPPKPEKGQETIALAAYHLRHLRIWDQD